MQPVFKSVTTTTYRPAFVNCIFGTMNGFVFPVKEGPVQAYDTPPAIVETRARVSPSHNTVSPVIFAGGVGFTVTVTGAIAG